MQHCGSTSLQRHTSSTWGAKNAKSRPELCLRYDGRLATPSACLHIVRLQILGACLSFFVDNLRNYSQVSGF